MFIKNGNEIINMDYVLNVRLINTKEEKYDCAKNGVLGGICFDKQLGSSFVSFNTYEEAEQKFNELFESMKYGNYTNTFIIK